MNAMARGRYGRSMNMVRRSQLKRRKVVGHDWTAWAYDPADRSKQRVCLKCRKIEVRGHPKTSGVV
jgi:hypothetical protein